MGEEGPLWDFLCDWGCFVGESGITVRTIGSGWRGSSHSSTSIRLSFHEHQQWPSTERSSYSLDAKNRLTVPARFRADFAAGLVLAKGIERCVALWKPADYDAFRAAALEGMHPLSPEARKLQTYFSANSMPPSSTPPAA